MTWCEHHQSFGNHSSDECNLKKRKVNGDKPPEVKKVETKSNRMCNFCKKPREWDHRCKEYRLAKQKEIIQPKENPAFNAIVLEDPSLEAIVEEELLFASVGASIVQDFISVPIVFNSEHKILAAVDSMAQISFVSPALVEKLKIQTTPSVGKLLMA
jgi:glutaredoxin